MPKRDYLSFERTPRPEEVQEDPPEQIEKLEHPAFIARFGRSDQADEICGRDRIPIGPDRYHMREPGDALHESREPLEVLERIKAEIGSLKFSAQYQQQPARCSHSRTRAMMIK